MGEFSKMIGSLAYVLSIIRDVSDFCVSEVNRTSRDLKESMDEEDLD